MELPLRNSACSASLRLILRSRAPWPCPWTKCYPPPISQRRQTSGDPGSLGYRGQRRFAGVNRSAEFAAQRGFLTSILPHLITLREIGQFACDLALLAPQAFALRGAEFSLDSSYLLLGHCAGPIVAQELRRQSLAESWSRPALHRQR